jgi:hypothetical protein
LWSSCVTVVHQLYPFYEIFKYILKIIAQFKNSYFKE